jgi:hypothetical protein
MVKGQGSRVKGQESRVKGARSTVGCEVKCRLRVLGLIMFGLGSRV